MLELSDTISVSAIQRSLVHVYLVHDFQLSYGLETSTVNHATHFK